MLVKYFLQCFRRSSTQYALTIAEQVSMILLLVTLEECCQKEWVEFKAASGTGVKTVLRSPRGYVGVGCRY